MPNAPHLPAPWHFAILVLAVYRVVRVVGWDDITAGWRASYGGLSDASYDAWHDYITGSLAAGRDPWKDGDEAPFSYARWRWAELVRCPWCAGWWASWAVWLLWLAWPGWVVGIAVPLALSAVVGFLGKLDE